MFTAIVPTLKEPQTSQISNLLIHIKVSEKQKQSKPKMSRWKEITNIREKKINETLKHHYTKENQ